MCIISMTVTYPMFIYRNLIQLVYSQFHHIGIGQAMDARRAMLVSSEWSHSYYHLSYLFLVRNGSMLTKYIQAVENESEDSLYLVWRRCGSHLPFCLSWANRTIGRPTSFDETEHENGAKDLQQLHDNKTHINHWPCECVCECSVIQCAALIHNIHVKYMDELLK